LLIYVLYKDIISELLLIIKINTNKSMKKNLFLGLGLLVLVVVVFAVAGSMGRVASNKSNMKASALIPTNTTTSSLLGQGSVCSAHNQCGSGYCQMTLEYQRGGFWPFYNYKQVNRCNSSMNSCIINSSMSPIGLDIPVRVSTIGTSGQTKAVAYNPTGYYKMWCGISPASDYGWHPLNSALKPPQGYPWFDFTGMRVN
jgi:hypothetical protein